MTCQEVMELDLAGKDRKQAEAAFKVNAVAEWVGRLLRGRAVIVFAAVAGRQCRM